MATASAALENGAETAVNASEDEANSAKYPQGWRLWILTVAMWLGLFLSTLETTIVSTSLVSITNALDGFLFRDWVVTAYLLTYTGFLTIYAKFSDIFGRKTMLLFALAVFTLFSGLCGASNSIVQLIILRAFQGVGASGIYSMIIVIAPELVPPGRFAKYMAIVSTVFIIASVLGPVLGGVINSHSTWRWVFLLKWVASYLRIAFSAVAKPVNASVPGGGLTFILLAIFLPASEASSNLTMTQVLRSKMQKSAWSRLDVVGMTLLLVSSVLLIFALEEGGTRFAWSSGAIISTLVLAIILGAAFAAWEVYAERSSGPLEAVFPPSLAKDRLLAAMLLTAFFVGFPFVSIIVNIPQRAQAVYDLSPVNAGLTLLPLMLASPVATAISAFLTERVKIAPFYIILVACVLQVLGLGLTCSLSTDSKSVPIAQYGYQVIMGFGFGLGLTTLLSFARAVVPEANLGSG
ncbi:hypothetical protein VMCG_05822 [Cytospora schulzeri]|uniref:Major facilitator superfamily (MFS) profile domain-containing protein n=1 Tax=Cytospora schulzeri TaxID=448051 RepID=A0A423WIE0_9PEZI|nr:hypothetical protein VMCG_05822 [Valsa malicola]